MGEAKENILSVFMVTGRSHHKMTPEKVMVTGRSHHEMTPEKVMVNGKSHHEMNPEMGQVKKRIPKESVEKNLCCTTSWWT